LYNLSVEVKDSGIPPLVALFNVIIYVTDVNEKSRNIKISGRLTMVKLVIAMRFTNN
jgi:hypothetical protein